MCGYVYKILFYIFRLMGYTDVFLCSLSGVLFPRELDYSTTKRNRQTRQNHVKSGKSRTAVYVDVRSCFRHLLLFLLDFVPHTWQFVVYISFHLQNIKPENRVLLYTFMFAGAFGIVCYLSLNSHHIPGCSWYKYNFIFKT